MLNSIRDNFILKGSHFTMKIKIFLSAILLSLLTLTGCGKDAKLEQYKEDITAFTENVSDIKLRMEEIDTSSEDAVADLLICLDELNVQFTLLADMEVPKEFISIESLADEAGSYMTEAVSLYHEVFEAEEFDAASADIAAQYYDRAMLRLSYISTLLQGELPEGDNIIITEEEVLDFEPVTEIE